MEHPKLSTRCWKQTYVIRLQQTLATAASKQASALSYMSYNSAAPFILQHTKDKDLCGGSDLFRACFVVPS